MMSETSMDTESVPGEEKQEEEEDDYEVEFIQPLEKLQRPRRLSVPELLAVRQGYGVSALALPPFARPRKLMTETLASKVAWNPTRLQNMILTVGPGTPAVIVDLSAEPSAPTGVARGLAASSSSSSASSEEEDDDDDDDDEALQVAPTHSRSESSASSASATSPKRTLSDRMKPAQAAKQDMNLETNTTSGEDEESEDEDISKEPAKKPKATSDEEMEGYSDVEETLAAKTESQKEENPSKEEDTGMETGTEEGEGEPLEELTDRERFYLEINQAEEHRMQFSEESGEENKDDDEDEEEDTSPRRRFVRGADDEEEEEDDDDDDEEMADFREMAAEWFAMEQAQADDDEESNDDDDDDEDSDHDHAAARIIIRRRVIERSASPSGRTRHTSNQKAMKPSIRHGGCINTAAWLDAGWRLSTVSSDHYSTSFNANHFDYEMEDTSLRALSSDDCPTQLVTSGDDRLVKFWDVRHAMGSANPLPWGRNTHCPFAFTAESDEVEGGDTGYRNRWRDFYRKQQPVEPWQMFGNVLPLASLQTGHRGNVFHVTPMWQQPGKVATCGADGYLRLGDVEASSSGDSNSSSIIISPEYFDDGIDHIMSGLLSLRPGMCFSHHFLNSHVGLLCSERGLRKFDVRLPPRQQERRALISGSTACKACAVWTASSASSIEEVDSTYVFAGGTGAEVALYDLRMTGGDSTSDRARVVCQYLPRGLKDNEEVSVSGLDLSRDKRELLVSYESDQIYTFPIFPNARSAAGPTLEEIDGIGRSDIDDDGATNGCMSMLNGAGERRRSGEDVYYNELASYGGHLNRFTFLKNAKYAGPNDEFICTGSDSGHAWVYERSTGAVVSLLNADHSTCNGVIPHPSLPFFITYGIDSTAKLWRGTSPVDPRTDDSRSGRSRAFNETPYEMSPLARDWDTIETELSNIEQELAEADAAREDDDDNDDDDEDSSDHATLSQTYSILPDQVLSRKELISTGSLGRSILRRFYTPGGAGGSRIGNDLHSLPEVLRKNQFECIRAAVGGGVGRRSVLPVESDLRELMRRVSLIRLRHQADRQGISNRWNCRLPWIFEPGSSIEPSAAEVEEAKAGEDGETADAHPADLVPENPSDWIPYDPEMTRKFFPCGISFNLDDYGNFYRERYLGSDRNDQAENQADSLSSVRRSWRRNSETDASASARYDPYKILHETARVLKDGGNEALRKGDLDVAARRYDKAIRYCSVAFMSQHGTKAYGLEYAEELMLISMKVLELDLESDHTVTPLMLKWSPLLKVLISTRLNLSMLLLKQAKHQREVPQLEQAKDQARHALRELLPFCTQKGKICLLIYKSGNVARYCASSSSSSGKGNVRTEILKSKEPEETYQEAKTLEAKAYFRLGSAQSDMGEYGEAIKSFDRSIECTLALNPDAKLDPLVVRRLAEAKREKVRQSKRHRKKFRMMFAQEEESAKKSKDKKAAPVKTSDGPRAKAKDASRRRTTMLPVVSPSTPAASRHSAEDRGTQSE